MQASKAVLNEFFCVCFIAFSDAEDEPCTSALSAEQETRGVARTATAAPQRQIRCNRFIASFLRRLGLLHCWNYWLCFISSGRGR